MGIVSHTTSDEIGFIHSLRDRGKLQALQNYLETCYNRDWSGTRCDVAVIIATTKRSISEIKASRNSKHPSVAISS